MDVVLFLISYIITVNIVGFALMGLDKWKAVRRNWRIPESTLFIIAIIGGSVGSIIGMYTFHHKTRRWLFAYGMPAILVVQIIIFILIMNSPIEFGIM